MIKKKPLTKKKISRSFYKSKEWTALALLTKKLYGRVCMKCGTVKGRMNSDHCKPRSLYPELALDINNIAILCRKCNKEKSNKHCTDYRTETHLKILREFLTR